MKTKRIIPVFFILILSLWPVMPLVESAGYGEENENLGQFTDDFENLNNVSVMYQVERNATLEAMELNFTSGIPAYEDFSTYTEVDPNNRLTIDSSTHFTWVQLKIGDGLTYIDKDYGGGYFGQDFVFTWIHNLTEIEAGDADSRDYRNIVSFHNTNHNPLTDPRIMLKFTQIGANDSGYKMGIRIDDVHAGFDIDTSIPLNVGTEYYCRLERIAGDDVTFELRTGSFTGPKKDTLTVNLANFDDNFRYISAIWKRQDVLDINDWMSGTLELLWNQTGSSGYLADGYFTTEDYLNYTTGQGLTLLTNASIPYGTSMTVQFSNDNATWVDNEGNVGGATVLDGFYAIDLRDLNYTDSFKMYNLTTTDFTITPRLFQSRLVTTNGTAGAGPVGPGPTVIQNVTGEWIEYNLTEIDVLIGVHDSGDVNSTLDIDGDTFNCSEVVGAPGYRISFNWTNVDTDAHCFWVVSYIYYDGNQAHDIHIELYNFSSSTWIELGIIDDDVAFEWHNVSIYDLRMPNDFINAAGEVWGRFDHVAAGNINHDIHIEYLKLQAFIPFESEAITEVSFFWIFIAIVLSIITALLVWMKFGNQ